MQALLLDEIKVQELKLLEIGTKSLAEYASPEESHKIFMNQVHISQHPSLDQFEIESLKSVGFTCNANLKAFAFCLLSLICSDDINEELLDFVKSIFFSPSIELTAIKNQPYEDLQGNQMKKIIVEFFYSLRYSQYENKLEIKLNKYPIILDIMVLFFREILKFMKVKHSENYIMHVQTSSSLPKLIDFFDLHHKTSRNAFVFPTTNQFIYQNKFGEILIGICKTDKIPKIIFSGEKQPKNFNFAIESQFEDESQEFIDEKQNNHLNIASLNDRNRSFRGLISESIVISEAPTPSFNNSQFENSFLKANPEAADKTQNYLKHIRHSSVMKSSQDVNLEVIFEKPNQKKKVLQQNAIRNLKESIDSSDEFANSPITLDSPQTPQTQFYYTKNHYIPNNYDKSLEIMKKSNSEKGITAQKKSSENSLGYAIDYQNYQKGNFYKNKNVGFCNCSERKWIKNKLSSHVYDLNLIIRKDEISFISKREQLKPEISIFHENSNFLKKNHCPSVAVKGNNFQEQVINFRPHMENKGFFANPVLHRNIHFEMSEQQRESSKRSSPDYDNFSVKRIVTEESSSRREISPVSQRSNSPYGGTKSIQMPKIYMNYLNPMKTSMNLTYNHRPDLRRR